MTTDTTVRRNRSDLVTVSQAVAGVEHELITTATRSDGGWEALCLCGKVVETPRGTRRQAEIALENHITTLREWADVAAEAWSWAYPEHQSLERYGVERAAPTLDSDLSAVPITTRAVAAYYAFLDRMLDKDTHDVLQVLDDYIVSELGVFREAYVVRPVVPSALSDEHDPAFPGEHDPAFPGEYAPAFSDEHDLAFPAEHPPVFSDERDGEAFLGLLGEVSERFGIEVHAYCLMHSHYHLLIHTPRGNLGRAMRHLNGVYTQLHNRRHGRDGPLFRGRYKAILVEAEGFLARLGRYIHRVPVAAAAVTRVEYYLWSSYRAYVGRAPAPPWLGRSIRAIS